MLPPRTIRLRRPPVLSMHEGTFVPRISRDAMGEVEQRWRDICDAKPASYDGRVCHVLGVNRNGCGGAVIHAVDSAFRFYAVQDESFDLGVRVLGVKGIVQHGSEVLMGRRSAKVGTYPGLWEFAPGGAVEPGEDPAHVVVRELAEETGLAATGTPKPVAILFDPTARTWEVVFFVSADDRPLDSPTGEYDHVCWVSPERLPEAFDLSPAARQMLPLLAKMSTPADCDQQPNARARRTLD